MPVNNSLNLDFTNTIKQNNHGVAFTTSKPNGNLYNQKPKFIKSKNKPSTSNRLELTGTWTPGTSMSIKNNGTINFGDQGPNLLMYLDASSLPLGPINDISNTNIPRSNTSILTYGNGNRFTVVAEPSLPGGKGIIDGTLDSTFNGSTQTNKFWCYHEPHTAGFEMRCNVWPLAHQDAMVTYIAAQGAGNFIWQEKGIWNMANGHYGGADTNLFYGGAWRGYGTQAHGGNGPALLTSNSLVQIYGIPTPETNRPNDFPPTDPTTYEYFYDQYAANELALGYVHARQYCESLGVHVDASYSNYLMTMPDGPYRIINSFSFPGFVRGFNYPLGLHRLDGFIYKTNGAGARCRVILTNNANYKLSTKVTPMIIEDWSRYEIVFMPVAGWFDLGNLSGSFLNIVGADGNQIEYIAL